MESEGNGPVRSPAGVVAACCLSMTSIGIATNTPAVCLTTIAGEMGLSKAQSGLFLSFAFWGLVVSIVAAGPLADRWGFRHLLVASALLQAAGTLVISRAPGMESACLGAGITGLGTGIADALLTPIACAAYPRARARIANLLHAFYPVGMLAAVLLILLLMHLEWSWRAIYRCMAALNLPVAAVFLFVALPRHAHEGPDRLPGRRLLRTLPFPIFLAMIFLAGLTELGPSQWIPAYVENAAGGTRAAGALGLLLLGTMMTISRLGNSGLSRRGSPRLLMAGGATLALLSLLLAALPAPIWATTLCLGLLGLGVAGLWPTSLSLAGDRFPQAGASMYSLLHACGNMGGLVGPLAIGLIAEHHGLRAAMATLALAPVGILALLSAAGRQDRAGPQTPPDDR